MFKISMLIIALHLVTSSDLVFASDPSAYEAAILRITTELKEARPNRRSNGVFLNDKKYEKTKLDGAEALTKELLGPDALLELRPIRNLVELAPFRDKIVLGEDKYILKSSSHRLASNHTLDVLCIYDHYGFGYGFYNLKRAGDICNGIEESQIDFKYVIKMRMPTHAELLEIRNAVVEHGVVASYQTKDQTLARVDN